MPDPETEFTTVRCKSCDAKMRLPASAAGRRAKCPSCGAAFHVPDRHAGGQGNADTEPADSRASLRLRCPQCHAKIKVSAKAAGRKIKCPACVRTLRVPARAADATSHAGSTHSGQFDDDLLGALANAEKTAPAAAPPAAPGSAAGDDDIFSVAPPEPREFDARSTHVPQPIVEGSRTCPGCKKVLPGNAKVCVDCGIYISTGRSIITTQDESLDQIYAYTEQTLRVLSWIIWTGIYPIASEAFGLRKPWVARGLFALTVLLSFAFFVCIWTGAPAEQSFASMMLWAGDPEQARELLTELDLDGIDDPNLLQGLREARSSLQDHLDSVAVFRPFQLITHAFLHADLMHLAGNMIFLMVFGTRVNALIGNLWTVALYPLLAIIAALAHMASLADGPPVPMLGASGAVMGLAGMYLVLFPVHKVHMVAWIRWGLLIAFRLSLRFFAVRGFWVVLFYIAFDVVYTVLGAEDNVAHWAHIGGFVGGAVIALILLTTRLVDARGGDILSTLLGRHAWKLIGRPRG